MQHLLPSPTFLYFVFVFKIPETGVKEESEKTLRKKAFGLSYLIDESPPWYICLLLGFQVSYHDTGEKKHTWNIPKGLAERSQYFNATSCNIVGTTCCIRLATLLRYVAMCGNMLDDVGSNLKMVNFSCNILDVA